MEKLGGFYMETMIPGLSIAAMVFSALVGIAVPVVLYIVFRKKGANHLPFWIGCITFVLFAFVLERLTLSVVMKTPFWTAVTGNLLLYGIVAGLFAGVFEEAGRFLAFKTVLRKKRGNDQNALMYGAGHGGIEAILLLSLSMILNTVFSLQYNAGIDSPFGGVNEAQALINMPFWMLLMGAVERLAAITIHISLSVLVWFAAKNGKRFWLFPLAILLHAFVDAVAVILSRSGVSVWIIEGAVYVIAIAFVFLAIAVWKKNHTAQAEETPALDAPEKTDDATAEEAETVTQVVEEVAEDVSQTLS